MGVGRPGLAGGKGLGMKGIGLHLTTFNAPLMTLTPVMFFHTSIMLLLLVLADLHGEMVGGCGPPWWMYIDENCVLLPLLFSFFFSIYPFLCSHSSFLLK